MSYYLPVPARRLPRPDGRPPRQPRAGLVPHDVRGGEAANRSAGSFSVIFDNRGAPVWYKRTPVPVLDFKRLSNGTMVYVPQLGQAFGVDPARGYLNTNLNGSLVAGVSPNGEIRTVNPDHVPDRPARLRRTPGRRPGDVELSAGPEPTT